MSKDHGIRKHTSYTVIVAIVLILFSSVFVTGCQSSSDGLKDGYYTAEDINGSHGWYEYLTIYVNDGKIVSAEYNSKNSSGFIKSWDMDYMRIMNSSDGTYPNQYTRTYAKQFLELQSADGIDAISGATHSYHTFTELANAVIAKSKAGDASVALVDVKIEE